MFLHKWHGVAARIGAPLRLLQELQQVTLVLHDAQSCRLKSAGLKSRFIYFFECQNQDIYLSIYLDG